MEEGKLTELFKNLKPGEFDFDRDGRVVIRNEVLKRELLAQGVISANPAQQEDIVNGSGCTTNQSSCGSSRTSALKTAEELPSVNDP